MAVTFAEMCEFTKQMKELFGKNVRSIHINLDPDSVPVVTVSKEIEENQLVGLTREIKRYTIEEIKK